jgi:hypothetical protein
MPSSAAPSTFVDASVLILQRRLAEEHGEMNVNQRQYSQEVLERTNPFNSPSPNEGSGNAMSTRPDSVESDDKILREHHRKHGTSPQRFPYDDFTPKWDGNYQAMKQAIQTFNQRCVHTSPEELETRIRPIIKTFAELHTGVGAHSSSTRDFYHKGLIFAHQFMDLHEKSGPGKEILERGSWLNKEIRAQLNVTHMALMRSLLKQPSGPASRQTLQQAQAVKDTWLHNSVQAQLAARESGDHEHFCARVGCKRDYSVDREWTRVNTPRREGSVASDWTEIGSPGRLEENLGEVHGGSRELPIRSILASMTADGGKLQESEDWEDITKCNYLD